jgi:hypothetical protein
VAFGGPPATFTFRALILLYASHASSRPHRVGSVERVILHDTRPVSGLRRIPVTECPGYGPAPTELARWTA